MSLERKLMISYRNRETVAIAAALIILLIAAVFCLSSCGSSGKQDAQSSQDDRIPIKVLILPKFQEGYADDTISGDFPGEGQYYLQNFMKEADRYKIEGGYEGSDLLVKDGIAYCVIGMTKVNAALTTTAILNDERFDFSDTYILSVGCAGSARDTTVMGDVFLITAAVDYDIGHHADSREMENPDREGWFHDKDYDDTSYVLMDPELMDKVYALIKDVPVKTTKQTRRYMSKEFDGAKWATRDPKVLRGTTVTADNYWKGEYGHRNALLIVDTYPCPDPYVTTEMEDIAVASAVQRQGMLDHLIILRTSVNMDVFAGDTTPESLWDPENSNYSADQGVSETADIFPTSMKNIFDVSKTIIQAIQNGDL